MRIEENGWKTCDEYPKRVSNVFQQVNGEVNAIFALEYEGFTSIFVLYDNTKISYYVIWKDDSAAAVEPTIMLKSANKEAKKILAKKGFEGIGDDTIASAFTFDGKTILVSKDRDKYYQVKSNSLLLFSMIYWLLLQRFTQI